jgi:CsoR family transcriptional regulator, copper-sensing transcriptional repressor
LTLYPLGGILAYMKYMDNKNKVKVIRRLKLIEGQARGLQKMVENDTYCIDVITQTSAVKQGLSNVEDILLENHLRSCVSKQVTTGQVGKTTDEILKVYKLKRK